MVTTKTASIWTGAAYACATMTVITSASSDTSTRRGIVVMDIQKLAVWSPPSLTRRGDAFTELVANEPRRGGYFISTRIGTPGQELTLLLDTGSSDTWVPAADLEECSEDSSDGCDLGTYSTDESATFDLVQQNAFQVNYLDGTHAAGDYFSDTFMIGDAAVPNFTMGLGKKDTNVPFGVVGVGFPSAESGTAPAHKSLPLLMVEEGLINTNAYSLWLNALDATMGHIMFGGIDTAKYVGDMTRIPLHTDPWTDTITAFTVALTSLSASSPTGTDRFHWDSEPVYVVLDSGSTLSWLPTDLAEQMWAESGAVYDSHPWIPYALIPCDRVGSAGHFTFGFAGPDGPRINISMAELVLDDIELPDGPFTFDGREYQSSEVCLFGVQNGSSDPFLLGDTFLRSAYVVYDLVNKEIGIAATNFNATESRRVPFKSNGAVIPSATLVVSSEQATQAGWITRPSSGQSLAAAEGFGRLVNGSLRQTSPDWVALTVTGVSFIMCSGVLLF